MADSLVFLLPCHWGKGDEDGEAKLHGSWGALLVRPPQENLMGHICEHLCLSLYSRKGVQGADGAMDAHGAAQTHGKSVHSQFLSVWP